MLNLLLTILIILAAYYFYRKKHAQDGTPSQPTHYDLLDSNGNPIPSQGNRARPSINTNPAPARVSDGSPVGKTQPLRHFCIKDKGYHVSVWPKVQGIQGIDYLEFSIAGITHGEHVDDHLGEFIAALVADPANPYDSNAIKIITREGHRVGYVPRDTTTDIRSFTTLPCACHCYIGINNNTYFTDCYITRQK